MATHVAISSRTKKVTPRQNRLEGIVAMLITPPPPE
jgi:hypothetical protein